MIQGVEQQSCPGGGCDHCGLHLAPWTWTDSPRLGAVDAVGAVVKEAVIQRMGTAQDFQPFAKSCNLFEGHSSGGVGTVSST